MDKMIGCPKKAQEGPRGLPERACSLE